MAIKKETDIITENKKLSDEILQDLKSKGGDNMNGEEMTREKLGMEVADLSSRLNTKMLYKMIKI